jgi:hypothetical protein
MFADGARMMLHTPSKNGWTDEKIQYMMDGRANEIPWFTIASGLGMTMAQCQRKFSSLKEPATAKKGKWSDEELVQLVIDYQQAGGDFNLIPPRGRSKEAVKAKVRDLITSGLGDQIMQSIQQQAGF